MTPISADLAVKLALVVGGLGLLWYASRKAGAVVSSAAAWVGETADNVIQSVNPLNNENVFYNAANSITGGGQDTTLGGRIYEFFNPEPAPTPPRNTGGATGQW